MERDERKKKRKHKTQPNSHENLSSNILGSMENDRLPYGRVGFGPNESPILTELHLKKIRILNGTNPVKSCTFWGSSAFTPLSVSAILNVNDATKVVTSSTRIREALKIARGLGMTYNKDGGMHSDCVDGYRVDGGKNYLLIPQCQDTSSTYRRTWSPEKLGT